MAAVNTEKKGYRDEPICDSHVHLTSAMPLEQTAAWLDGYARYFGCSRIALLGLPHSSRAANTDPSNNLKALYLKSLLNSESVPRPGAKAESVRCLFYALGGLFHHFDARDTASGFLAQVEELYETGYDGVKLLLGKPELRKRLGVPLDDPLFDPFYRFCEDKAFPVTLHLGDPAAYWLPWDNGHAPNYDASFPTLDGLRAETEGILLKHPRLDLVLCHFYFIADDPDAADEFLMRYPNAKFDLTPGSEMYAGFSRHPDEWCDFFRRHRTRILFGTDADNWARSFPLTEKDYEHNYSYIFNLVRNALEAKEPFRFEDVDWGPLIPLDPDDETRRLIYSGNFIRRMGEPRPIAPASACAAVKKLIPLYEAGEVPGSPERAAVDLKNCRVMEKYFGEDAKLS